MDLLRKLIYLLPALVLLSCDSIRESGVQFTSFSPGEFWLDNKGKHINAHGGGMLFHDGKYYWFGEIKSDTTNNAMDGVSCYSSEDLYNWKNEGTALSVSSNEGSDIEQGCIIERPKVIYNPKTKKFVMWFHLELKGQGYSQARAGMAVSDKVVGPYTFVHSYRPNAGVLPEGLSEKSSIDTNINNYEWWTPKWTEAVEQGLFVYNHKDGGQMSRDMTLFVDDDGKAYHIYSSEENLTLHIAELSDDFMSHTGRYIRIFPAGHNEAPAIFKRNGKYYMITSGCTGWDPNAARLSVADSIMGEWKSYPNPCVGKGAELTFRSQSTFIFPIQGKTDSFIFMADRWTPKTPQDGTYVWLPIQFKNDLPYIEWFDEWNLDFFEPHSDIK